MKEKQRKIKKSKLGNLRLLMQKVNTNFHDLFIIDVKKINLCSKHLCW